MIDERRIEEAKEAFISDKKILGVVAINDLACGFKDGAKWAINELKDLFHPASEVPRNDNGKILAFSKVNSNMKLYDMNAMLNETACDTYQEMWEIKVRAYTFTDWVFVEDILDLIKKGGKNE